MNDRESESDAQRPGWPRRNLAGILDETFAVYGRHWRKFIGIVLVTQLPESVVTLIVIQTLGWGPVLVFFGVGGASVLAKTIAFGATVQAVGQHYVNGRVDTTVCYRRVWAQIVPLVIVSVVFTLTLLLIPGTVGLIASIVVAGAYVFLLIPAIVALVYWSMTLQIVMTERIETLDAIKRSVALVKGNWLRLFGTMIVLGLMAFGMSVVLNVPFVIGTLVAGLDTTFGLPASVAFAATLLIEVVLPPVLFIAGTLMYYSLRFEKEPFNLATLRQELEIAPV